VSLSAMSPRFAADTRIGAASSAALPTGGEGSSEAPAKQLAKLGSQRVRALGRATRSANGSGCSPSELTFGASTSRSPHARRRRSDSRLQIAAGGPGPLTEDRQKTGTRL
jgi:hypothetical protein